MFRCPSCKLVYKILLVRAFPQAYLITPELEQKSESNKKHRDLSKDNITALNYFGLNEDAKFEQVKTAWRELVKQYHPDKVAHLGPDLRSLADSKTKEINLMYDNLQQYFTTP